MIAALFPGLLATLAMASSALSAPSLTPAGSAMAAGIAGGSTVLIATPAAGGAAPQGSGLGQVPADLLLGQRIMVGFDGTSASRALLRSVRRGHVGAVILFAANIGSRSQVRSLTRSLQRAARRGGNPPLLIAVDQEGGLVKRLPFGPPDLSPPQIAATGSTGVSRREGRATGRYLSGLGINMDLAPVADVPTFGGAFIWQQGRAFSFNANAVARYATAFAVGLQQRGVAATAKHFPGLGSAAVSTDNKLDELHPSRAQRRRALRPYRKLIANGVDAIMVTTSGFPAYDPSGAPAAFSRPIIQGVLRGQLHFGGVAITDSLAAPTGHDEVGAGVLAAEAGADILLFTDSARGAIVALQRALGDGRIGRADAEASYARILALKRSLGRG